MQDDAPFDLRDFMPYLLNQAADASSRDFQSYYKGKYGMLRTEWRVLFHLGRIAQHLERIDAFAMLKTHPVLLAIAPDFELKPFGQSVHDRHTHSVQAA